MIIKLVGLSFLIAGSLLIWIALAYSVTAEQRILIEDGSEA